MRSRLRYRAWLWRRRKSKHVCCSGKVRIAHLPLPSSFEAKSLVFLYGASFVV